MDAAAYESALKLGKRFFADSGADQSGGVLPALEHSLTEAMIEDRLDIGTREVPLSRVAGTYAAGRSGAFAGNFMPLLGIRSEFAKKWMSLYRSHLDEGIRDPIMAYEYLGRYYVVEGNKRVSVLKFTGAYSVSAHLTRIISKRDPSNLENTIYYEFLDFDRRFWFPALWFSAAGRFTRLIGAARAHLLSHPALETDAGFAWLYEYYRDFSLRYREAGFGLLPITTGDAFLEYVLVFGFPAASSQRVSLGDVRACLPHFHMADPSRESGARSMISVSGQILTRPGAGGRISGGSARVAFLLSGAPSGTNWTRSHELAVKSLCRTFGNSLFALSKYNITEENTYTEVCGLLDERPDLVFAAHHSLYSGTLRAALEYPGIPFLCCSRLPANGCLNTYSINYYETSFVCGLIAGALTGTGRTGFALSETNTQILNCDVNAFAAGLKLIRPDASVRLHRYVRKQGEEYHTAWNEFAEYGVDIALLPFFGVDRRRYGEPIAMLCSLDRAGRIERFLAAPCVSWEVFYSGLIRALLEGSLGDSPRASRDWRATHYRWGLGSGLLGVLTIDAELSYYTTKLTNTFVRAISNGTSSVFEGPLYDNAGRLRIVRGERPDCGEIMAMDWFADGVIDN